MKVALGGCWSKSSVQWKSIAKAWMGKQSRHPLRSLPNHTTTTLAPAIQTKYSASSALADKKSPERDFRYNKRTYAQKEKVSLISLKVSIKLRFSTISVR